MNKDKITRDLGWHDLLVRTALVVATVAIVVWAMPHDNLSFFHVEQGKPWKYAEFTAPYDFPVYKSEATINEERDSALRHYEPYYKYKRETEQQMVRRFMNDYGQGIPGLPAEFLFVISNRLHSLYQQGIMEQKEYAELRADTSHTIRVVEGKQAVSLSILEVYSPKSAYEQLFQDEKLAAQHRLPLYDHHHQIF